MSYDEFIPWVIGAAVVLGVAWAPVACTVSNNTKIAAAVERGVDPLVARCAYAANPDRVQCGVIAAQKGAKP